MCRLPLRRSEPEEPTQTTLFVLNAAVVPPTTTPTLFIVHLEFANVSMFRDASFSGVEYPLHQAASPSVAGAE